MGLGRHGDGSIRNTARQFGQGIARTGSNYQYIQQRLGPNGFRRGDAVHRLVPGESLHCDPQVLRFSKAGVRAPAGF